ncbi:MAG: TetR/AcrR family transcriptional regulator [Actinomycetota bacterium]|nr:TetR/AcrR family transcriptional regulator [Actinomycetota bacterium]
MSAEARRERIAEVAMEVFADKGYEGTSIGEIARAADITRPVVYDHFRDKKELYLWLLERERNRAVEHVTARLKADGPASVRIWRAIDAFFNYAEEHPFAWRMLFRESTGDVEIIEAHRQIQAGAHMVGAASLARELSMKSAYDRDEQLKIEMLAELWGSALKGLARWWYDRRDVPRAELVSAAMDALWVGLERLRTGERWQP